MVYGTKGNTEQPDEELHKVRSGRVPSTGASVFEEFVVYHPHGTWMFSQIWMFICLGFCGGSTA